ncbi:MAG TPA: DUF882 domain-containing protein [Micropepsaceae bacterium]|nr:DUF882 domain-containing protein [Micropepsaceae bacterium]
MRVSRRQVLSMGGAAALVSAGSTSLATNAVAAPSIVGLRKLEVRTLSFDCTNAGEQLIGVDYWVEGEYVPDALADINWALRDYRTGEVYPIATNLLDLLYHLGTRLETNCRFELTSGYRSPETNAALHELDAGVASNSLHMKGEAADISMPGRPLHKVHETALALRLGGVGYYPDPEDDFIHVDIGRVRHWVG